MNLRLSCRKALALLTTALLLTNACRPAQAADSPADSSAVQERQFIGVLQGNAAPAEKALACKQLAIYGSKNAVPALAPLLADPHLASWARIALEAIPDPAADAALRKALGKLEGKLLIGVINSIAYRRDAKAVSGLAKRLKQPDPDVASAAAVALGRIGGPRAAKVLAGYFPKAPAQVRSAVAEGCIRCAEGFLAQGNGTEAARLYDSIRVADVPMERALEATRGAILARGSAGLPLLMEQLQAEDKAHFGIGLSTARELPGQEVTKALVTWLPSCPPERQSYVLLALADRKDPAVLPAVVNLAGHGSPALRLTAVKLLDRLGDVSTVPVLLDAATSDDKDLASAAMTVLDRLPGNDVDADLFGRLSASQARRRQVLLELAVQRHIERALPLMASSTQDTDAGVRAAAVQGLGTLGGEAEAARLVSLLGNTSDAKERAGIETALVSIGGRKGSACVPALLPLAQNTDPAVRTIAIHALASAGGADAVTALKAAVDDTDAGVQDEAVRTLAAWPSNWPEDSSAAEPLLDLARSGKKPSYQVLGLRGYLQWLEGDKQLKQEEKVARLKEALPLVQRPEEKRQAIAILEANAGPAALDLLLPFAAEPAVTEEACSALLSVAGKEVPGVSRQDREKALQAVVANTKDIDRKKHATNLLHKLTASAT